MTTLDATLAQFNGALPLAEASTVPGLWYTDLAVYEAERRKVFHGSWQCAGRVEQVAEPGQFFTLDLAGEPVLVVRDKEGRLNALANVCRHRAARVECRESGKVNGFRCRYHGWAYNLKGQLAGAPDFEGVQSFCKEAIGLPKYTADTWGPFVFVHLGTPAETLAAYMRPVQERSGGKGIERLKFAARRTYEMKCNWKIFCDNYLDGGYHIPTLHPGLAKVVDMDGYHTIVDGLGSLQLSPLRKSTGARADETLNAVRSGDAAHYWWLWPNFMINIYEGTMDVNTVLPLAPDRCLAIFDFYFDDVTSPAALAKIEQSLGVAHQVQLEDMDISEEVQRGLSSATYATGRFSVRREEGGYYFHQLLAKALRA